MTDDAKPKKELEVPRNVWVRGGTTTGAFGFRSFATAAAS